MKKKFFLTIFSVFIFNSVLAQTFYFSSKNSAGGLMIGIEPITKPTDYNYEWTFPDISLTSQKTNVNFLFFPLSELKDYLFINLQIVKIFSKEKYSIKNQKISLAKPKVKIVRKTFDGILLPLSGKIKRGDYLTLIAKDFASKNLTYSWEFNGVFISNEKEISTYNLKGRNGVVRLKVTGLELKEKVEDIAVIQIE